ncbi:MAG: pyridoxamine 5'-phosphate oxidase, partial [Saprospiraceae bacterium]
TNYESNKAREMAENPNASLVFWWDKLQRQVRIKGKVEKLDRSYSEQYFQSRPRGSQLSAWASPQSRSMTREELERRRMETEERFKDIDPIPLPEHWGGYLLRPEKLEFWQGRANRYHDRFEYKIDENGNWQIARLAP